MKKIAITAGAVCIILTAFITRTSGIHGTVSPADGAKKVWALRGRDTVTAMPFAGTFTLNVKPGNWQLQVEAIKPYKDVVIKNIIVEEGRYTDAGEVKLSKD